MSEQNLDKFFVVFYKNIPHFRRELDQKNWNEFLRKVRGALSVYQAGKKSQSKEENLQITLLSVLRDFNFEDDIQNILNSSGLKAAETDQTKPRRVSSVRNSIEEISRKIEEEEEEEVEEPDTSERATEN